MPRIISKFAFRSLLTIAEKAAITERGNTDTIVRVFLDDLAVAAEVDLDDAAVADGLNYMVSIELLTSERVAEILSAPVPETPPTYTVTIKAMDVITPQNISGAIQRADGKWIVMGEFRNASNSQVHLLEMEFHTCPTQAEIDLRVSEEVIRLRGAV